MKTQTFFLLFISTVFFFGCKKDDPSGVQFTSIADKSGVFKVVLDVIVPQDDHFSLYYTTDGTINFNKEQLVWVPVKGSLGKQEVIFELPKEIRPSEVRIDFGNNTKQGDIFLQKYRMQYKGKSFEAPGTLVFSYFRPDVDKTEFNANTGLIRGIVRKGVRQSPSLYPKEGPLGRQIDLLTE